MQTTNAGPTTVPIYGATSAAREAGCSPSYLHRLVRSGRVCPSLMTADRKALFTAADVETIRAALRRKPEGEAA